MRRMLVASLLAAMACGGAEKPKPVAHETPFDHLRRIGTVWTSASEDEGLLQNDPAGVSTFHVRTKTTFKLGADGATGVETIDREERYQMTSGAAYACRIKGDQRLRVEYGFREGDVVVRIESGTAELPRACDKPGFPVPTKTYSPKVTSYLLRSDQLVSMDSARAREVLIPIQ